MSTVFSSRRVAPVAAVSLRVLTLGLGLATVPLDILTNALSHQVAHVSVWISQRD